MKKIGFLMAGAAMIAGLASCTGQSKEASLKSDVDSLSYAIGMAQTQGLKDYLSGRLQMDTTYMNEFFKGVEDGTNKKSPKDIAYMAGLQIGQQIGGQMMPGINRDLFGADSKETISLANFMAGFFDGTNGKSQVMTMDSAQKYIRQTMPVIKKRSLMQAYGENKAAGEKFLTENKGKEGVVTTESGLQYKVLVQGKGAVPTKESKVKVNYKGTLIDGTEFDSSSKHGDKPSEFYVNRVVKGWTEALTLMPVGSKWELYIPQELAYGETDMGNIKPFSTLIFEVELVDIVK